MPEIGVESIRWNMVEGASEMAQAGAASSWLNSMEGSWETLQPPGRPCG